MSSAGGRQGSGQSELASLHLYKSSNTENSLSLVLPIRAPKSHSQTRIATHLWLGGKIGAIAATARLGACWRRIASIAIAIAPMRRRALEIIGRSRGPAPARPRAVAGAAEERVAGSG